MNVWTKPTCIFIVYQKDTSKATDFLHVRTESLAGFVWFADFDSD